MHRYLSLVAALALSSSVTGISLAWPFLRRQISNPDPDVGGSVDGGWQNMPNVQDATAYPDWTLDECTGAKLPLYQTSGLNQDEVTRAVIVLPGKPRDCWNYWNLMNNALYVANSRNSSISRSQISIMGPCFWTEVDVQGGAAQDDVLIWGSTTWISGHDNVGPEGITDYSSFDALDALIEYYMDRTAYPNLSTVVIAGHSAGAQMVQRYAGLRTSRKNDDRLHFWLANPGSLVWLSSDRPHPNASCAGVDEYKYGLESKFPMYGRHLDRESVVVAYNSRIINHAWGLDDHGPGDTRCQAETQGSTHLGRGQNFVAMMNATFGWPANATVDWVEGVSHDNAGMMNSAQGVDKLFVY